MKDTIETKKISLKLALSLKGLFKCWLCKRVQSGDYYEMVDSKLKKRTICKDCHSIALNSKIYKDNE
jgi:RNase P subunit RPR2